MPTALEQAIKARSAAELVRKDAQTAVEQANAVVQALEVAPEPTPKPVPNPISEPTWLGLTQKAAIPGKVQLFSPLSFWNHKLTTNEKAATASNSASIISQLMSVSGGHPATLTNEAAWGKPVYLASTSDALVEVVSQEQFHYTPAKGSKFHIPSWAKWTTGGDDQMTIILPEGSMLDFYQVKSFSGTRIEATLCSHTKGSEGLGNEGECTAADFDLMGGITRGPELLEGKINHALFIVTTLSGSSKTAPARSNDGNEGWRLCLDFGMSSIAEEVAHVQSLGMSKYETALAVAMVEYGGYVGDRGGPGFAFGGEATETYTAIGVTNPWSQIGSVPGAAKVPWSSALRVIAPPPTGSYVA